MSGQLHALAALPQGKSLVLLAQEAGYVPRAGLDLLEKGISCLCWDLNTGLSNDIVTNLTILSLLSLNFTKNYIHRISHSLKIYYHTFYPDCTLSDASATSILQFKT